MSAPIRVDIWSDVQCPWCYIGKRKFEAALDRFDGEVEVEFHSYELSPDSPVETGASAQEYLAERKGWSLEQTSAMFERVTTIAASVGLDYHWDTVHHTNTRKAHELLHFAKAHGKQVELKEALMRGYFVEGAHVGRYNDLVAIAESVGLDGVAARNALEAGEYADAVAADVQQASDLGVTGVPFFVIEGRYGVSGAQETDTFVEVLEEVSRLREQESVNS